MKYKLCVYTHILLFIRLVLISASESQIETQRYISDVYNHGSKLEKIMSTWNRSSVDSENSVHSNWDFSENDDYEKPSNVSIDEDITLNSHVFTQNFPTEFSNCIGDHQYQITENLAQGKAIILNCFKATLILNLLKYLVVSPKSSIKLLNGYVELKKIPDWTCSDKSNTNDGREDCNTKYRRYFEQFADSSISQAKKQEYIKMYKKAVEKLMNEKNLHRNLTEEEKANQLNRVNEGSQAFLSEILRNIGNEEVEQREEEKLKREISDPRLMSVLNAFTRNYMLRLKFYPGVSARMMRSHNGGVTFDIEVDPKEDEEEEISESEEVSMRKIRNSYKGKDYDDDDGGNKKKRKKMKKKKKQIKKKVKKIKKILPYLLLPILIQVTLLPFVFKKLFFLAMKALFAGKLGLILVGFHLLRNTCIKNEDSYTQKIRVEHYGYNKGEEYGAWVNGRSIKDPSVMEALSEEPFRGQQPKTLTS